VCGTNLNEKECGCDRTVADPRMAAIQDIFKNFKVGVKPMSICPKNKSSKGRRNRRRANWKMTAPTLVK
jgi:rpmF_bact: ribosomal protein L32